MAKGRQNMWFALATNSAIDFPRNQSSKSLLLIPDISDFSSTNSPT